MGYYMSMKSSKIRIPAAKHDDCLAAIKALASEWTIHDSSGRHYSWVRIHEFANATTLREALAAWRWVDPDQNLINPDNDRSKDIEDLYFSGEKLGDDEILMNAIAPYVEAGSYIEMVGAYDSHWRWYFDGEGCFEQAGQVVYGQRTYRKSSLKRELAMNKTKADLVQEIYGNDLTIDYALPLGWVREWEQVYQNVSKEFNPVPHFVWAYPEGVTFGLPAPLTIEGLREIHNIEWPYHEPPYASSIAVEFSGRTN